MAVSFLFIISALLFSIYTFYYNTKIKIPCDDKKHTLILIIVFGFLIRILAAFFYKGHTTDMSCFNAWSEMLKNHGFSAFYTSDSFTDYPPGYMYILYCLGFFKDLFGEDTILTYVILKLPAIIADILIGVSIYRLCEKHGHNNFKFMVTGFFIFNPAVILNSAVWGQVDSVFTLFIVFMLFALTEGKMILSYFLFAVAVFTKPQALFYAPILLFGIIENVCLSNFSLKRFIKNLFGGICAIFLVFLLSLPFGIENVTSQYIGTIASYNFASVNAYNLWSALGFNWSPLSTCMSLIGYIFIAITIIISAFIFFSRKDKNRYFLSSAFVCFSVFVLSVKMHERYAFPAMVFLLCAYVLSSKKEEMYLYVGISALQFLNMFHVLFFYTPETAFDAKNIVVTVALGWMSVLALVFFCLYICKWYLNAPNLYSRRYNDVSVQETKLVKKDIFAITIITLIYSVIALYNLGDTKAPETFETIDKNASVMIDFGEEKNISDLKIYLGAQNLDDYHIMHISMYNQNGDIVYDKAFTEGNVFYWETFGNIATSAQCMEIYASDTIYIGEIGIFGDDGERIYAVDAPIYIIDEQDIVPDIANYRNSTYFDEIYHARTAYEFIHKLPIYEWTHPPLGKILISVGIRIFGMTPFGWRIAGTFFGIMMIPILYIFVKQMFGTTWICMLSAVIFAFDFMHFTQTRIATIDVYVTFFIILMYLFMYKYVSSDLSKIPISKAFVPLGLSGLCMGLGIACKWTGVYAGAGLAVIFFSSIFLKYKRQEINSKYITKTMCFCLGVFVLVPMLVYILSYIPFVQANDGEFYDIIQNQIDMFAYHSDTVVSSTHPYSSPWYQWIINYRPIWYYSGTNDSLSENISAFGNPAVWTFGFISFFYCVYDAIRHHNLSAAFLAIAYLAQLLPWIFVERTTFIYHYFPCVPFLVLMTAHSVYRIYQNHKIIKSCFLGFTIIAILLFIMFYPVISGFPIDGNYVRIFLRWLPSWQLIG